MTRTFWPRWLLAAAGVLVVAGCPNAQDADSQAAGGASEAATTSTSGDAFQANIDGALRSHTAEVPLIASSSDYVPDQPGNLVFEIRPSDAPPTVPIPPGSVVPDGQGNGGSTGGGSSGQSGTGGSGSGGGTGGGGEGGGGGVTPRGGATYAGSVSARRYVRCVLVSRGQTYIQDGWEGPNAEAYALSTSQDGQLASVEITRYSIWSDFAAGNLQAGYTGTYYEDPAGEAAERNYRVQYTVLEASNTGPTARVVLSLRVDIWSLGAVWTGTGTQTTDVTFSGNQATVSSRVEYFVVMDTKPSVETPVHYDAHHIWEIQGTLNR